MWNQMQLPGPALANALVACAVQRVGFEVLFQQGQQVHAGAIGQEQRLAIGLCRLAEKGRQRLRIIVGRVGDQRDGRVDSGEDVAEVARVVGEKLDTGRMPWASGSGSEPSKRGMRSLKNR